MKWLRDRFLGRRQRSKETSDEQVAAESRTPHCRRPRLAFLIRDASGPAAYRLHTFRDAASAADFVQFWFPPGLERGTIAFWASDMEPARQADTNDERPAEVVVLTRDEARPGIIYPFSFSNMAQARSWLTKETPGDPSLRSALVYWALPVRISRDHWGKVRFTPAEPSALRRPERAPASTPAEPTRTAVRPEETPRERSAAWREREDRALKAPAETDDGADVADTATANRVAERRAGQARNIEIAEEIAEILREVDRIFRERRWKQREGPFQGFGSPPGKF